MTDFVRAFLPVLPDWVEPGLDEVAALRRAAVVAAEADPPSATAVAIGAALDWVAGMAPDAPVSGDAAEPTRARAAAERLAGTGQPAAAALAWLLGESDRPPGV